MRGWFGSKKSCCDSCYSGCYSGCGSSGSCGSGCCGGSGYGSGYGAGYGVPAGQVMPKAGENIPAPKTPAKKMPDGKKTGAAPLGESLGAPALSSTPASPRTLDLGRSPY